MRKLLAFMFGLAAACVALAAEPGRADFAYAMPLAADGSAPLYELTFPAVVYERTVSPALADVRVLNGRGEVLPYSIVRRTEPGTADARSLQAVPVFPLHGSMEEVERGLDLRIRSAAGNIDLNSLSRRNARQRLSGYLLDLRPLSRPIVAIEAEWHEGAREFSDLVSVEASDDLVHWRQLAAGPLLNLKFNGQSLRQRRIEFTAEKANYWRVLWPADREAATLSAISVQPAAEAVAPQRSERVRPAIALAGAAGEYAVDLGAHLPVDRISLRLPERNTVALVTLSSRASERGEWRTITSASFFRLVGGDRPELTSAPLAIPENRDRFWKIAVSGAGGGLGVGAPELVAGWMPETLVFVARGDGPYELVFGNALASTAEMPLASVTVNTNGANLGRVAPTATTVGAVADVGGPSKLLPPPPPLPWKTWALWAVLGAGVLVLAYFAWKLTRELEPGG